MANPREHIRSAQAAELKGDKSGAVAELRKAAELYRRAGNSARALQLLRHARTLAPGLADLSDEIRSLEWLPDTSIDRALQTESGAEAAVEDKLPREWPTDPGDEVELPGGFVLRRVEELPEPMVSPQELRSDDEPDPPPALIERGPTRADPAIDAWCSFCCRPRAEVGELVAGPTGSFICSGCVGESGALLGLEGQATPRPQSTKRKDEHTEADELVGQQDARALLERALQAGARRVLVIGPVGTGKTIWFRELARLERGTLVTLEALEQGTGGPVVLVEDVDRLLPEAQERLGSFLARHPERTVLMSARGSLGTPRLVLHGVTGSLPVLSTRTLSEGVLGAVPVSLLEQMQLAIPLQVPSRAEFIEIARRRLAPRASELSVTEDVLAEIASEAAGSPRAGHELNALLTRVLAGAWSLADPGQDARNKEGGAPKPKASAKPARRGRRKGEV